jgi:hypothetical protein
MNKKIAVCLSGHLRNFDRLIDNFNLFRKKLEQHGKVDIFIATWDKQEALNSWSSEHGFADTSLAKNNIDENNIKKIYQTDFVKLFDDRFYGSTYSPINYFNLTDKKFNFNPRSISGQVIHSSRMFFLIYEANLLKKYQEFLNNEKYDIVFRTRPDYKILDLDFFNDLSVNQNSIYYANAYEGCVMDDQFAFGDSDSMDKYSSCFLKHSSVFNSEIWGDPEYILSKTLSFNHNLNINIINRVGAIDCPKLNIAR